MTIEERLEALEKETQKLRDVIEIMNLKGKYFRCLDSKDWDGLETTFSPNVSTSYSNGKLSFHGPKEVTNYFKQTMPAEMISMHMGHTPEITVNDDGTAVGRWYLQDNLIFTESSPYAGIGIQGGAFYTDKYEKIDGKWLNDGAYLAVHTVAVGAKFRGMGVAKFIFANAFAMAGEGGMASVRVDTHQRNAPMRALLSSLGFVCCGGLTVRDGFLAYERPAGRRFGRQ